MEGQWKFQGGRGSHKPEFLKKGMWLNWNFQRVGLIQTKKPSVGGVGIFSGATHFVFFCLNSYITILKNKER